MAVHPEIQALLDFIASRGAPPLHECTPEEARINMAKGRAVFVEGTVELPRVEQRTLPAPAGPVPIRLYAATTGSPLPILVYFHGGGWVIGDLDSHDDACRRLAQQSGCLVVSVDYRLAPEHKFPAAVEDAWAATQWVAVHGAELGGDPTRLAVGGDSAGGNLAAVVAQLARANGGPALAFQLLVYPAVDDDTTRPSCQAHGEGYILTFKGMQWFWNHYLHGASQAPDLRATPFKAPSLAGLPPALVQLAEYDVLLDEGMAYAERLRAEGVPVTVKHYPGAIHAFFTMSVTELGRQAVADAAQALKAALGA
ncbi:MAG TPA: alpha/beta hydrolase [bacterium]|nr:alpha/beta hydrolase [bacterium]